MTINDTASNDTASNGTALGAPPDPAALEELAGRFLTDFGAAAFASTVVVGDKLGLYKALAEAGPVTAAGLAARTGLDACLLERWLTAQAVSGYAEWDGASGTYWLTPEQVAVLADDSTPAFLAGAMTVAASLFKDEERVREALATGGGLAWHDHHHDLFDGTERLFKPGYRGNLVATWIPALDGVEEQLRAGARVADVGCGHGASTILLAQSYPASTVVGFDYHEASIEAARARAAEAGVADRVRFEVASAADFPGERYDLVCIFDALHDMGDPVGAARHIRESLAGGGTWLLVEPALASEGPTARIFAAASLSICTPSAQAQPGGAALGNQVSDERWRELLAEAGFGHLRRVAETPVNRVFEVRR